MRTPPPRTLLLVLALFAAAGRAAPPPPAAAPIGAEEAREAATEAYIYAYPLVLMDVTRRVTTNTEAPDPARTRAPINQFCHLPSFPDASFTAVVRPNADTLYSSLWYDVSKEPLVISVPESPHERYYLLPMLDLWTDVFASPGKRTTGTIAQTFAIASPSWQGQLPDNVTLYRSPTPVGWIIGRTQTNGPADYDAVHRFQAGFKAVPLSAYGQPNYSPPKGTADPSVPDEAPADQVARMDAATFFKRFTELTKDNPPHANDYPVLARMRRIGIVPGQPFDPAAVPAEARQAITDAPRTGMGRIKAYAPHAGTPVNGWDMITKDIGTYGTNYTQRALVAYTGLGANVPEDAIYPSAFKQPDGQPLDSARQYTLTFPKGQLPPARAFWSLTMYNDKQLFADNPLNRYALGDRDKLSFAPDGSLTLYLQRTSPGPGKEANWLPTPAAGPFTLNLRLYWPRRQALTGEWDPPSVRESGTAPAAPPAQAQPAAGQVKPPQ